MITKSTQGFTLIEIMVALAIFAILAAITAQTINRTMDTRHIVLKQANRLNEIQMALAIIQQDVESMAANFRGNKQSINFIRNGIVNPQSIEKRSSLQTITYTCHENTLTRTQHKHTMNVLTHLTLCEFAFLNKTNQVIFSWNAVKLPVAIRLSLNLQDWGEASLLFNIPQSLYNE